MGYSPTFLQFGAGLNQLKKYNIKTYGDCMTSSFCDDPRDAYFIKMGALLYDEDNN